MNYKTVSYIASVVMLIEAGLLLIPTLIAILYGESVLPFLLTAFILLILGLPRVFFPLKDNRMYAKDGFLCVAISWILLSLFGALPFVLSGTIPNYIDALFETVSGFTTTGATILSEIASLPRGILFWRSFTHWIGGMGVLVFILAILPAGGGQAIHLLRAEVPGPTKEKIVPKLRSSALILYGIYIALTAAEVIALLCTGLPAYDAFVNAFATAGTGGFSVLNDSIAGYGNPAAEWVIAIFMFLFGVNFSLYFFLLVGRVRDFFKSEELRLYAILTVLATAALVLNAKVDVRTAFFQVTSISSTTGFTTVDFNTFPEFSKMVLLLLFFTGACAGSTAGGLKLSRVMILCRSVRKSIRRLLRPNSVNVVKMDGDVIPDEVTSAAGNYLVLYLALIVASVFLLSVNGLDFTTNVTAALTCVNNVGPGLSLVGPSGNFAGFSILSKIVLSFDMLFGRLEIFPMLALFSPSSWKKR